MALTLTRKHDLETDLSGISISDYPAYEAAAEKWRDLQNRRDEAKRAWQAEIIKTSANHPVQDAADRVLAGEELSNVVFGIGTELGRAQIKSELFTKWDILAEACKKQEKVVEDLSAEASAALIKQFAVRARRMANYVAIRAAAIQLFKAITADRQLSDSLANAGITYTGLAPEISYYHSPGNPEDPNSYVSTHSRQASREYPEAKKVLNPEGF